jgi:hypothetical protein
MVHQQSSTPPSRVIAGPNDWKWGTHWHACSAVPSHMLVKIRGMPEHSSWTACVVWEFSHLACSVCGGLQQPAS